MARIKILFLASNDLVHDPRLEKQLYGASQYGYEAIGLGWQTDSLSKIPYKEKINGYRIERIPYYPAKIQTALPWSFGLIFLKIYKLFNRFALWLINPSSKTPQAEKSFSARPPSAQSAGFLANLRAIFLFFRFRLSVFDIYASLTILFAGRGIQINPQIVHANDLDTLWAGYLIKKRTGAKLVYDAHEFWTEMHSGLPKAAITIFRIIEKSLLPKVDAFVSVNQSLIDEIGKFYQIDFRRLGIMTAPIYNAPYYQKVTKTRRQGKIKILYQGRFEPHRGLEEFIRASDKLTDCEIYFRGYGDGETRLRTLAVRKKVKNLQFLLPVKMGKLVESASFADIGLLPYLPTDINHLYCSPNKLFEYMMAGLALAVSDLPELMYIVRKYKNGILFNPKNPKSIARALNFLIKNPQNLAKMKKNSLLAAQHYNWANEEKKLVALYHQILRIKDD